MIAKITKGVRFGALAAYLHGPGSANEHTYAGRSGGAVIGGNLAAEGEREGGGWAATLRQAAAVRPDIERPVWHVSLRNPESDRTLSDSEWAMAGQDFAQKMGFEDKPWVMVRHGQDHVHLVLCRVNFDGQVWSRRNDRYKAQRACTAIEADFGLAAAPRASTASSQRGADHQVTSGEWRRGMRQEKTPQRVVLAEAARQAAVAATGAGRVGFEAALAQMGVEHQANVATTGRVSGYRFHLKGHVDVDGAPVWFRASQLDKALAWSRLAPALEGPAPVSAPHLMPIKKRLETKGHHRGRAQRQEAAARLSRMPMAINQSLYIHDQWWHQRVVTRDFDAATRALARQREASEVRARAAVLAVINQPRPTLSPAAQAELRASIEESSHHRLPPTPERGSSFER